MMRLDHYEGFIASVARKASRRYRGSYCEFEDYVQVGQIALLTAVQNWKPARGDFPRYARTCIAREIMAAAIGSQFTLSASLKRKRVAIRAVALLSKGASDRAILRRLRIDTTELDRIRQLTSPVIPLEYE